MSRSTILVSICLLIPASVHPCDLSEIDVTNYTYLAPNHIFDLEICIGAGRTGVLTGGDASTGNLIIAFENGADALTIVNVSPGSITGQITGNLFTGLDAGPQGAPYESEATYAFINGLGDLLACIDSEVSCGSVHQECYTITFTLDDLPNSVRVYGAEGGGNPLGGCWPNADMSYDFSILPVELSSFTAHTENGMNYLNWTTETELNNDFFSVERSASSSDFTAIGKVDGHGTTSSTKTYSFADYRPSQGTNYYRLRQVDFDGKAAYSKIIMQENRFLGPVVFPNPSDGQFTILGSQGIEKVTVLNSAGQIVRTIYNAPQQMDLTTLSNGYYSLHFDYSNGQKRIERIIMR